MIAACGLDCTRCDVFQAVDNPRIAQRIIDWFSSERGIQLKPEDVHCEGCRGDRANHWSADCWILECCVDDKGFDSCYECEDFPCQRLKDWAKGSERYGDALERLKGMRMR